MDPIKGRDPLVQKLMGQRAETVQKQRDQLLQKQNPTVTNNPDGSQTMRVGGHLRDESNIRKATSQVASSSASPSAERAKTGALADKVLNGTVNKPFDEGLISEQTRDDLLKMVNEGTLGRDAATYLASSVDNLGGDVMVNIALDLCKQDPEKFKQDFKAGDLYNTLVQEHHDRYYPKEGEAEIQQPEAHLQPLPAQNDAQRGPRPEKHEATPAIEHLQNPPEKSSDEVKQKEQPAPEPREKPVAREGNGIKEAINKPFDEGIISEKTRDDLLEMVENGKLDQHTANYLASNVSEIGGDVMVNIALDLCKEDPAKFNKAVQSDTLYQAVADEHHRRYYPSEE